MAPLIGGTAEESYLGLDPRQIRAIIRIESATQGADAGGPLCSGTFVAPGWVVTAKHCSQITSPTVAVGTGSDAVTLPVIATFGNPDEDVALLQVNGASASGAPGDAMSGLAPIPIAMDLSLAANDVVEVAGYGLTDEQTFGSLRFLTEELTEIGATVLHVNGFGANGACEGDSGGPLLVRSREGIAIVAGVLSTGSPECVEGDSYVRLDTIASWIRGLTGTYAAEWQGCGSITAEGRCLYGGAVWCDGRMLAATACSTSTPCGWSVDARGFRCSPPGRDSCAGVDAIGICRDNAALRCVDGVLDRVPCDCSACRVDGKTGSPRCGF